MYVFDWLYQCLPSFYSTPFLSLCTAFDAILSNQAINPFAKVFIFEDFNVHHKDFLTYSDGTERPGELCHSFSISNDFTQMVNFPTRIPHSDYHSHALLDFFLSSYASICSTMVFPPLRNFNHVVVSVSIDFLSNSKVNVFRLKLMYKFLIVSVTSSLTHLHGFQLLMSLPQLIEISFFVSSNKIKLLNLKQSSDRLVIVAKGFLKLLKLFKTRESITFQKIGSRNLQRIANSVLSKSKSAIPPLFNGLQVLSSASD